MSFVHTEGAKLTALETKVLYLFIEQIQHGQQQCKLPHIAPPMCLNLDLERPPLGVRVVQKHALSLSAVRQSHRHPVVPSVVMFSLI